MFCCEPLSNQQPSSTSSQILVENGRAVGVRMANGDVIKANKAVISACGVFNT